MQPFEYASPKTLKEALPLLGAGWTDAAVLAVLRRADAAESPGRMTG